MNFIDVIQGNRAFQVPPSLMEAWDENYDRGHMLGLSWGRNAPAAKGLTPPFTVFLAGSPGFLIP